METFLVSIFLLFTLCLINLTVFSDENSHQKQTLKVGFYQIDFYQENLMTVVILPICL